MSKSKKESLMAKERKQAEELKKTRNEIKKIEAEEKKKAAERIAKALTALGKAVVKEIESNGRYKPEFLAFARKSLSESDYQEVTKNLNAEDAPLREPLNSGEPNGTY